MDKSNFAPSVCTLVTSEKWICLQINLADNTMNHPTASTQTHNLCRSRLNSLLGLNLNNVLPGNVAMLPSEVRPLSDSPHLNRDCPGTQQPTSGIHYDPIVFTTYPHILYTQTHCRTISCKDVIVLLPEKKKTHGKQDFHDR